MPRPIIKADRAFLPGRQKRRCERDSQFEALWCFELRDRAQPQVKLGDELQLNLIELPKADRLGAGTPALAAWVAFLEHWQEETRMSQITYAPVQQALEHIKSLSADDETRRLAFVRERALRDERSEIRAAREEGKLEGKLEGEVAVLARLLTRRFGPLSPETRLRLQDATTEQLERWADRMLDAQCIDEVFAES